MKRKGSTADCVYISGDHLHVVCDLLRSEVSYAMKFTLAFKGMRDVAMERCFLKSKGNSVLYEI